MLNTERRREDKCRQKNEENWSEIVLFVNEHLKSKAIKKSQDGLFKHNALSTVTVIFLAFAFLPFLVLYCIT